MRGPLLREVANAKYEIDGLLVEIRRTQEVNRQVIGEYFRLMETKVKNNDSMFMSKVCRVIV